jgi:predicted PurR-regulated permease PerM
MSDPVSSEQPVNREGWWTRDHALIIVLVAATTLLLVLCWQLAQPFIAPLAWALALAVVAHPLHEWLASRIKKPGLAAGIAVLVIAVVLAALVIFVGHSLVTELAVGAHTVPSSLESGQWREQFARIPWLGSTIAALEQQANLSGQFQSMASEVGKRVSQFVTGSGWAFVELLLTLFVLFYLFRDRRKALATLRSLVPLSEHETDQVFTRVADTIHATIFGTLVVAAVQGALGGLMFWWLSLPAPILWGAVMALLAIVPVLGAFIIWLPAAIFLAATGQWGKAAILTAWGGIVVALIDNLLYPILVGKRLRLHTVPVFFAIVGGLAIFGAAGLILGPLILALTDAILEIWRRRTAHGRPAETGPNRGK